MHFHKQGRNVRRINPDKRRRHSFKGCLRARYKCATFAQNRSFFLLFFFFLMKTNRSKLFFPQIIYVKKKTTRKKSNTCIIYSMYILQFCSYRHETSVIIKEKMYSKLSRSLTHTKILNSAFTNV